VSGIGQRHGNASYAWKCSKPAFNILRGPACPACAIKKTCGDQCQFVCGCTPRAASGVNLFFGGAFLGSVDEKKELLRFAAKTQKGLKELAYTKPGMC